MKPTFKRLLSGVLSMTMLVSAVPPVSVFAENTSGCYPYTLFASSTDEGAITVNAGNFCVNGNVAVNGTINSSGNMNINGVKTEEAGLEMMYIFDRLDTTYFSSDNVEVHEEDYTLEEMNININSPLEVVGEAELTGNISINSAIKALKNVELYGEVKNTNNSTIYSKYGDIIIDSANVNLNGLVYAPFGNVVVTAQNLNLNNVVIIANTITLNCPNVNANYSSPAAELVGTVSEPLDIPVEEWAYMKDENENDFPDFFEDMGNWSKLKDSDGDKLPDCVEQYIETNSLDCDTDGDGLDDYYELMILGTDPILVDTDENGIADGDEDFDEDGLINYEEYNRNTNPWNPDSDADNLLDGDEVNIYYTDPLDKDSDDDGLDDDDEIQLKTDPLNPDTNGNKILDGEEKYPQAFEHKVLNDCAVDKVVVSMVGTGNLQKTTTVDSIMDEDVLCSDVVGLVGEPFEITSTSEFDAESNPATITFYINQDKLGETSFEDLLFLWYDENNDEFVELETIRDFENSCVSINTTHFSKYMLVDQKEWFEAWRNAPTYFGTDDGEYTPYDTVICVDCSGSMDGNDSNFDYYFTPENTTTTVSRSVNYRTLAVEQYINSMLSNDRTALITFTDKPHISCKLTSDKNELLNSISINNTGGTNVREAIKEAINQLKNSSNKKTIILLSDGDVNITPEDFLTLLNDANININDIKLFTIGLGNGVDSEELKKLTNATGEEPYTAKTASELTDIYGNISKNHFDTSNYPDLDGDKIPDLFEEQGLICSNGKIFYTLPDNPDTDGDGAIDGDEIHISFKEKKIRQFVDSPIERTVPCLQLEMHSNPLLQDSDEDGINDIEDNRPIVKGYYSENANDVVIGELAIISCATEHVIYSGHAFFCYQSYVNDTLDFSGFYGGYAPNEPKAICSGKYTINKNEYVSFGGAANDSGYNQDDFSSKSIETIGYMANSLKIGIGDTSSSDASSSSGSNASSSGSSGASSGITSGALSGSGSSGLALSGILGAGISVGFGNLEGGIFFNRELHQISNGKATYTPNATITREITQRQFNQLIKYLNKNNWYSFLRHNCTTVAREGWNLIYRDNLESEFSNIDTPLTLKHCLETRNSTKYYLNRITNNGIPFTWETETVEENNETN